MVSLEFCRQMPKVELHVHLEGSIRPETVLKLANRHGVKLPADTVEGLSDWYQFRDFPHFVEIYVAVSKCLRTPDDIELIAREFLDGQAAQNVLHSEVTYSATTIEKHNGIPWKDQHAALKRALDYGKRELGVSANFILDIVRGDPAERGLELAKWVADAHGDGVCALGLAGIEKICPANQYAAAFAFAHEAGVPIVPHAGETQGADSMTDVINATQPVRIGHGVRCIEDRNLVARLRESQIPLEVNPSSNVCLGVFPSLAEHSLPMLLDEGLYITINSDDPPMFSTTLSEEFHRCSKAFQFNEDILYSLSLNAANACLLPPEEKKLLVNRMREGFNSIARSDEKP